MSRFKIIAAALFSAWELGKRAWELGGKVLGQGGTFEFLEDDKAKYPSSSLKSSEERKKEYTKNLQTEKIRREKAYQKAITDLLPTLGKDTEQSIKDITPDKLKKAISEYIKETLTESNFNMDTFKKLLKDRKRLDKFIEAFFKGFNLTELKLTNIANMMVGYIREQVLDPKSPIFQIAYQANQLNTISQHETALKNMDTSKMTDEDHEALKNIGIYLENPPSMLESIWLDAKNGRERLEQDQAQKELEEAISKVEQPSQEPLPTSPTSVNNTRPEPKFTEPEPVSMETTGVFGNIADTTVPTDTVATSAPTEENKPNEFMSILGNAANTIGNMASRLFLGASEKKKAQYVNISREELRARHDAYKKREIANDPSMEYFYSSKYQDEHQNMFGTISCSNINPSEANNFSSPVGGSFTSPFSSLSNEIAPFKIPPFLTIDDILRNPKIKEFAQNIAGNETHKQLCSYDRELHESFQDESPLSDEDRSTMEDAHDLIAYINRVGSE